MSKTHTLVGCTVIAFIVLHLNTSFAQPNPNTYYSSAGNLSGVCSVSPCPACSSLGYYRDSCGTVAPYSSVGSCLPCNSIPANAHYLTTPIAYTADTCPWACNPPYALKAGACNSAYSVAITLSIPVAVSTVQQNIGTFLTPVAALSSCGTCVYTTYPSPIQCTNCIITAVLRDISVRRRLLGTATEVSVTVVTSGGQAQASTAVSQLSASNINAQLQGTGYSVTVTSAPVKSLGVYTTSLPATTTAAITTAAATTAAAITTTQAALTTSGPATTVSPVTTSSLAATVGAATTLGATTSQPATTPIPATTSSPAATQGPPTTTPLPTTAPNQPATTTPAPTPTRPPSTTPKSSDSPGASSATIGIVVGVIVGLVIIGVAVYFIVTSIQSHPSQPIAPPSQTPPAFVYPTPPATQPLPAHAAFSVPHNAFLYPGAAPQAMQMQFPTHALASQAQLAAQVNPQQRQRFYSLPATWRY